MLQQTSCLVCLLHQPLLVPPTPPAPPAVMSDHLWRVITGSSGSLNALLNPRFHPKASSLMLQLPSVTVKSPSLAIQPLLALVFRRMLRQQKRELIAKGP